MNNHIGKASTPVNLRALELIREAFERSSLTQEALASRSGIPRSTLANMLSPSGKPRLVNIDWFARLAEALGSDAAAWMDELEAVARAHLPADELAVKRAAKSTPAPAKRAAREQPKPRPGE